MLLQLLRQQLGFSRPSTSLKPLFNTSSNPSRYIQSRLLSSKRPLTGLPPCSKPPLTGSPFPRTMPTSNHLSRVGLYRSYHGSFHSPSSAMSAYWTLFGINAAVFGALKYAEYVNDQKLQTKILRNTLMSLSSFDSGRWWTTITSAFTHTAPFHIIFNMMAMHSFCSIISMIPVAGTAINIYAIAIGAAITGAGGFLYNQRLKVKSAGVGGRAGTAYYSSAIGASGAVMGLGAVATCLMPRAPMSFMFIPVSFPLWVFTLGYAVVDAYFLDSETSYIAHAGHLGGLVFGTVYYFALMRKAPIGLWRDLSRMLGSRR